MRTQLLKPGWVTVSCNFIEKEKIKQNKKTEKFVSNKRTEKKIHEKNNLRKQR